LWLQIFAKSLDPNIIVP